MHYLILQTIMKTNPFAVEKSLNRPAVGCTLKALTLLQAAHFFTFRFSVQTTQQSLKSPLERKSVDKTKSPLYFLININEMVTWIKRNKHQVKNHFQVKLLRYT